MQDPPELEPRLDPGPPRRQVSVANVFNLRDLGGYRSTTGRSVRWRSLYRGDGVHRADVAGRASIVELGVSAVLDLRTSAERDAHGWFDVDSQGVQHHHLPVMTNLWDPTDALALEDPVAFLAGRYLAMTEEGSAAIAEVVRIVAKADGAVVFHCSAGKDRTGVVAAVILSLLEVPDHTIAHDYGLSRNAAEQFAAFLRAVSRPEDVEEIRRMPASFMASPPPAMRRFLQALRERHGSVEGFAREAGVDGEAVEQLRHRLLI